MTKSTKSPPLAYEVKAAVDDLGRAFETFKDSNDLAAIEKKTRGTVDALLDQKIDRINDELDRLQANVNGMQMAGRRPAMGDATFERLEAIEHKAAFYDRYVRKGLESGLDVLESKALSIGVDADGGFAVPEELDQSIENLLKDISPIRRIANVVQIGTANYKKLVNLSGAASGWVAETAARTETATPTFAEVVPSLGELYANPAATQQMLDDAYFNVEEFLAEELAQEFGAQEGAAFVDGDGVNKPTGFLQATIATTDDSSRAFGTLQYRASGVDADFPAADPSDILVDLIYDLRPVYRAGAVFVMNTNLIAEIRKFKDLDGNYLWRPGLAEGVPATLLGYPVVETEDMPDKASDSLSIGFGNFRRGYTITDRTGTRILRDPYSNKPFVHFYATKRTGGGVVNSEAIKLLKFGLT
jgi:HK97 family phage major capsid protein